MALTAKLGTNKKSDPLALISKADWIGDQRANQTCTDQFAQSRQPYLAKPLKQPAAQPGAKDVCQDRPKASPCLRLRTVEVKSACTTAHSGPKTTPATILIRLCVGAHLATPIGMRTCCRHKRPVPTRQRSAPADRSVFHRFLLKRFKIISNQ